VASAEALCATAAADLAEVALRRRGLAGVVRGTAAPSGTPALPPGRGQPCANTLDACDGQHAVAHSRLSKNAACATNGSDRDDSGQRRSGSGGTRLVLAGSRRLRRHCRARSRTPSGHITFLPDDGDVLRMRFVIDGGGLVAAEHLHPEQQERFKL